MLKDEFSKAFEELQEEGVIEDLLKEKMKNCISQAIDSAFSWGKVKKAMESRIEEVMVPAIEKYDMSEYVVKLDTVLTEIVNNTALVDNKRILNNFKHLMIEPENKQVTINELFDAYKKFVSSEMETDGREVDFESGEPQYKPMEVSVEITHEDKKSWSSLDCIGIDFFVGDDEYQQDDLSFTLKLSRITSSSFSDKGFQIKYVCDTSLHGLSNLTEFEMLLIRLSRSGAYLIADDKYWKNLSDDYSDDDVVYSENQPEATFS